MLLKLFHEYYLHNQLIYIVVTLKFLIHKVVPLLWLLLVKLFVQNLIKYFFLSYFFLHHCAAASAAALASSIAAANSSANLTNLYSSLTFSPSNS